ncbi:MAG: hypothetical protein Q8N63_03055 [Nanoarchaeota archaeon]|nr:hypothetical protein [Nanoarchaeota archaeon]
MGMRNFDSYFREYKEFYEGILDLARLEEKYLSKEPSFEETKEYNKIIKAITASCPEGITIEDLIGVVVVGELKKKK